MSVGFLDYIHSVRGSHYLADPDDDAGCMEYMNCFHEARIHSYWRWDIYRFFLNSSIFSVLYDFDNSDILLYSTGN